MSRAFGDFEAKCTALGGNPNVLIAEPEVKSFEINDHWDFLIIGSDGIYEIPNEDLIRTVWDTFSGSPHQHSLTFHQLLGEAADNILKKSVAASTLDNVTWVLVAFNDFVNKRTLFEQRIQDMHKGIPKSLVMDVHLNKVSSKTYTLKKKRDSKDRRSSNNKK